MKNLFEGLDLSSLSGAGKEVADLLYEGAALALDSISSQSRALGESALKTVSIANKALREVVSGALDTEGALAIVRRSGEQLEDLARAEGNLILASTVSFLKKIGESAIRLIPSFLKP